MADVAVGYSFSCSYVVSAHNLVHAKLTPDDAGTGLLGGTRLVEQRLQSETFHEILRESHPISRRLQRLPRSYFFYVRI